MQMILLQPLRKKIGTFLLYRRKKHLRRLREVQSFNTARSVGIIFYISPKIMSERGKINELITFLESKQIDVEALGYVDAKNIPSLFSDKYAMNYFCKKDLNWLYQPKTDKITKFMNKQFDLLIDLDIYGHFPLVYIATLSRAKFKVGRYLSPKVNGHDMLLNINQNLSIDYMIEQTKNYLTNINN